MGEPVRTCYMYQKGTQMYVIVVEGQDAELLGYYNSKAETKFLILTNPIYKKYKSIISLVNAHS